jgi:hypothetical protein
VGKYKPGGARFSRARVQLQFSEGLRSDLCKTLVKPPLHSNFPEAPDYNPDINFENMAQSPYSTCYSGHSDQIISKRGSQPRFLCLGSHLPISEEVLRNELEHAAKLDRKHRGELAELAFMRKAATLGFAVAKPWGECDRYDVIVRIGKIFWRVQIKSAWHTSPGRRHYRFKTTGNNNKPYSADEIDFLVAYVFPEDAWYVLPVALVENKQCVCVRPGSKRSWLKKYCEAWKLMRPPEPELAAAAVAGAAPGSGSTP